MRTLIQENRNRIRAIIKKMMGSYNEDIEQEVYIRAFENGNRYKEKGKLSAWLAVITSNICKDYFRTKHFKSLQAQVSADEIELVATQEQTPDEIIEVHQRQKIILNAVDSLPAKMRDVVVFYEFEEMSYEEIATKLKISVGTVKSRLFNARLILSQKLAYLKGDK